MVLDGDGWVGLMQRGDPNEAHCANGSSPWISGGSRGLMRGGEFGPFGTGCLWLISLGLSVNTTEVHNKTTTERIQGV